MSSFIHCLSYYHSPVFVPVASVTILVIQGGESEFSSTRRFSIGFDLRVSYALSFILIQTAARMRVFIWNFAVKLLPGAQFLARVQPSFPLEKRS